MLSILLANPLLFVIVFPGLLAAITIHEFAHAFVADKLGDPTPRHQERVTLDPRAHLDPWGTLMILFTRFGWGKPVEFDPYNLSHPVRDTALIALAGPITNLVAAAILALIIQLIPLGSLLSLGLIQVLYLNVVLAIFNLVPVYPLDGSKILASLLPAETALEYEEFMNRYGIYLLLALLIPWGNGASPISSLISPVINTIVGVLL